MADPYANNLEDEQDDELFREVYSKEYTGPPRPSNVGGNRPPMSVRKRDYEADEDDDRSNRDPYGVPRDFTSREARAWEARNRAIERIQKRKLEEELKCKVCGEVGHFAQGCPNTLGNRRGGGRPGEESEKIALKDQKLKSKIIGAKGAVIQSIEKESGCRVQLEDNPLSGEGDFYVRITGKREGILVAAEAVKKIAAQYEEEKRMMRGAGLPQSHLQASQGIREMMGGGRGGGEPQTFGIGRAGVPNQGMGEAFRHDLGGLGRGPGLLGHAEGGREAWPSADAYSQPAEGGNAAFVNGGVMDAPGRETGYEEGWDTTYQWPLEKGHASAAAATAYPNAAEQMAVGYVEQGGRPGEARGAYATGVSGEQAREAEYQVGEGAGNVGGGVEGRYDLQKLETMHVDEVEDLFRDELVALERDLARAEDAERQRHQQAMKDIQAQHSSYIITAKTRQSAARAELESRRYERQQQEQRQQQLLAQQQYQESAANSAYYGGSFGAQPLSEQARYADSYEGVHHVGYGADYRGPVSHDGEGPAESAYGQEMYRQQPMVSRGTPGGGVGLGGQAVYGSVGQDGGDAYGEGWYAPQEYAGQDGAYEEPKGRSYGLQPGYKGGYNGVARKFGYGREGLHSRG